MPMALELVAKYQAEFKWLVNELNEKEKRKRKKRKERETSNLTELTSRLQMATWWGFLKHGTVLAFP